ncbi:MAG: chromate efflux transporter [Pseudomonadota bacterium]
MSKTVSEGVRQQDVSYGALARAGLKVGLLSFGGPAGQIALMHRIFVEEKKWIDEARYLSALDYCMLLPGPEAQQLAVYVGWIVRGVWGGVIAGLLFVAPGALVIFALAWGYALYGEVAAVSAMFVGVKAAVLAIVMSAVLKIGKRALKGRADMLIAGAAFVALFFFGAPFPAVILTAALLGVISALRASANIRPVVGDAKQASLAADRPSVEGALRAAFVWGAMWLAPVVMATGILGRDHVVTRVGWLFSHLAVVTFGGAYAVLSYLREQAVDVEQWLAAPQMIDGLGLAETTPGPLVLVNQFVGFFAGWNAPAGGVWLAAVCALMASWCTFAPSFLWIFAGAPLLEGLRQNRIAASALRAITAAVLGVILNLAIWFGLNILFRQAMVAPMPGGHDLAFPVLTSADPLAWVIFGVAALMLQRFKINMIIVIALCACLGSAGVFPK